jgi:starch synthase
VTGLTRGVWHIARECGGVAEAGGLKDVVAGLARALHSRGVPVAVVVPRYGFVDLQALEARPLKVHIEMRLPSGEGSSPEALEVVDVHEATVGGFTVYLLDSPRTREKRGVYTYTQNDEAEDPRRKRGTGHWDAHHLNLILQRGALELASALGPPDVFHCHDGHAAFLPAMLACDSRYRELRGSCRALITIHNAGWGYHQEIHDLGLARQLTGLPASVLRRGQLGEAVDPLLLGALFAPANTVSEGYAREIRAGVHEALTGGLGAAYRDSGVELLGITNGIDPGPYDPRRPCSSGLPFSFDPSRGRLRGKQRIRRHLLEALAGPGGSPELSGLSCYGSLRGTVDVPLYTFVGRLAGQKGVNLLIGAVEALLRRRLPLQFLILGQGEAGLEERLIQLTRLPSGAGKLCVLVGYNGAAAKRVFAAGDFLLVPSEYEPCGLTDLYAQMMGSLPIVHAVGGLTKVVPGRTGYAYAENTVEALAAAVETSLVDLSSSPRHLVQMRRQAFREVLDRYTWERVLSEGYLPLYRDESRWSATSR